MSHLLTFRRNQYSLVKWQRMYSKYLPYSHAFYASLLPYNTFFAHTYKSYLCWKNNETIYSRSKETKHSYLFQYKLSYKNETGTNHHGLFSTSVWCFKIFLSDAPKFFNEIVSFTSQIAWKQIFTKFLTLVWDPPCGWTHKKSFKSSN